MIGSGRLVLVAGLVLVLVVASIAAYMVFGAVAANVMARALPEGERVGSVPVAPYAYGPYGFHPFGFGFGPLGCLVPLLVFFVIFGVLRMAFFGPHWGGDAAGGASDTETISTCRTG